MLHYLRESGGIFDVARKDFHVSLLKGSSLLPLSFSQICEMNRLVNSSLVSGSFMWCESILYTKNISLLLLPSLEEASSQGMDKFQNPRGLPHLVLVAS